MEKKKNSSCCIAAGTVTPVGRGNYYFALDKFTDCPLHLIENMYV
jgi:hypothetical protein